MNPTPYLSDLEYIGEELQWIEARCRRLASESKARHPPSRRRGPIEDDDDPRQAAALARSYAKREQATRAVIDARLAASPPPALHRLCTLHGLDEFERTVLLLAAAPAFSKEVGAAYAQLSGDRFDSADCTVELIFRFVEADFSERVLRRCHFGKRAALVRNDLATVAVGSRNANPAELLDAPITVTARTYATLVGRSELAEELAEFSSLEAPLGRFDQVVLPDADKSRILSVIDRHSEYLARRREWGFDDVIRYGRGILLLFAGPPGTGKTLTAHAIAHRMGKRVLNVDIPTFVDHREADGFLPALFREARMQDAVLFFDECETLFGARRRGNSLMNVLLTEAERFEGVAILATNEPGELDPALDRRVLVRVEFRPPDREARAQIWQTHLPPKAPLAADVDVGELASRYELAGGYIKNAVLAAVATGLHRGENRLTMQTLDESARAQARRGFDCDEERVHPKVRLADVVLDDAVAAVIEEIVDAARDRRTVLEAWGVGTHLSFGKGVAALLSGPPGTGKTLCAEAIAGELHRPLYAVTAASLFSKWVGETEGRIESAFRSAKAQGAVLFVDEADGLLADRRALSSQHDARAVNALLTAIERFDGVVLLATNLTDRLDPALLRRMSWRAELPLPSTRSRAVIWRRLLPPSVPGAGDVNCEQLARRHELTGAQIKHAVFRAAFRAARVGGISQGLCEEAALEELGLPVARRMGGVVSA